MKTRKFSSLNRSYFGLFVLWTYLAVFTTGNSWVGNIYPLEYGDYVANLYGQAGVTEYPYWHAQYAYMAHMLLFKNGDLLLMYYSNILNLDNQYSNVNLNSTGLVVRTDSGSGKTIWARNIFYIYSMNILGTVFICITNDFVWTINAIYNNSIYEAIIIKLDSNGNLLKSFSLLNNINQSNWIALYFSPEFLVANNDDSVLILGETTYYPSFMGVSVNSMTDVSLFKIDANLNLNWISSFDYGNLYDQSSSLFEVNGTIFISLISNHTYLWICTLSLTTGELTSSTWIQSIYTNYSNLPIRFLITLISPKYIFAWDGLGRNTGTGKLMIFDTNSLALLKVYSGEGLYKSNAMMINNSNYLISYLIDSNLVLLFLDNSFSLSSYKISLISAVYSDFILNQFQALFEDQIFIGYSYTSPINGKQIMHSSLPILSNNIDYNILFK